MSTIRLRGKTYEIAVSCGIDGNGKKIRKYKFWTPADDMTVKQTEKELQRVAYEFERAVLSGTLMDENITLAEFTKRWLEEYASKQLEVTTYESYKGELSNKILPTLGHMRIGRIQPVHILAFLNNLLEDGARADGRSGAYSNRTVKYQHAILSTILQTAVYWQIIASNPCERVKVPKDRRKIEDQKLKFFTEDQAARFLSAIQSCELKYQAIANIAIYGGLRRGEILGLTWKDIDLDSGAVSINKSVSYLPEKGIITKSTKTKGSVRIVTLPENVMELLRQYKREQSEDRLKLGNLWHDAGLVFTQWDGKPMHPCTPYSWFHDFLVAHNRKIENDVKIPAEQKVLHTLPVITFHGLRHTSATLLIAGQTDVRTVSARLGHSQTSTTLNIYSHALKSADKKAAETLRSMLKGVGSK